MLDYQVQHTGTDADVCTNGDQLGEIYLPVVKGRVPQILEISDAENWYVYELKEVKPVKCNWKNIRKETIL